MKISLSGIFILLVIEIAAQSGFLKEQKKFSRVRNALEEKESYIDTQLRANDLRKDSLHVLMIAYKAEKRIDSRSLKKHFYFMV